MLISFRCLESDSARSSSMCASHTSHDDSTQIENDLTGAAPSKTSTAIQQTAVSHCYVKFVMFFSPLISIFFV